MHVLHQRALNRVWSRRVVGMRGLLLVLLLITGVVSSLRCSRHDEGSVSLFDAIAEAEPAGPWQIVNSFELAGRPDGDHACYRLFECGLLGDSLVQEGTVSAVEFPGELHAGENAFVDVEYGRTLDVDGTVTVRLLGPDAATERRVVLGRRRVMMRLVIPQSGARRVRIEHRAPKGTVIPLKAVTVLAMEEGAAPRVMTRARFLVRFRHPSISRLDPLRHSRFPVSLDGCTRDGIVLLAGDTLTFEERRISGKRRLRFWTGLAQGALALRVEARINRAWRQENSFSGAELGNASWCLTEVASPDVPKWEACRFILSGAAGDEAVILANPLLLPETGSRSKRENLLIVDLDTMRADRLSCYGYQARPTSVRLDSVLHALGFFAFRKAYSTAPWTLPATARFLTGRYLETSTRTAIPREHQTLAEVLGQNGYYCIAFTGGGQLRIPGFAQGFHEYYWTGDLGKIEDTFPPALSWLGTEHPEPFFLFLHTYEPHEPYTRDVFCKDLPRGRLSDVSESRSLRLENRAKNAVLTEEERVYVEAAYDSGIRTACDATADLLLAMDESQLLNNTIIAVLSDHGEEFWDHSIVYADHPLTSLYGELLRVPFLLYIPGQERSGIRWIEDEVSTVDLVPTVSELLGMETPPGCHGVSLVPAFSKSDVVRELPLLGISWHTNREWASKACVIAGGKKYIRPVSRWAMDLSSLQRDDRYPFEEELFLLSLDPRESRNVIDAYPPAARYLATLLNDGLITVLESEYPVDARDEGLVIAPDLAKQLRALGYLDETSRTPNGKGSGGGIGK
jgi:arylsulfatase A-like enzyme